MLSTVLDIFKETIEAHVWQSGAETPVKVAYIDLKNKKESLVPDAINLSLFTSTEMKSIMGDSSFEPHTVDNKTITTTEQKPALKLCLNVLLIFNLNDYINALDCYGQVLGYFYNNDILNVPHDGYNNPINVLTSSFNDHNEIEIRNSFNVPGTPLLRYDLLYALVDGNMRKLPAVEEVDLVAGIDNRDEILSPATKNLIYIPLEKVMLIVRKKVTELSAIKPDSHLNKYFESIQNKYHLLVSQHKTIHDEIGKIGALQEARPYLFALTALQLSIAAHQDTLVKQWTDLGLSASSSMADLQSGHQQLSNIANQHVNSNQTSFQIYVDKCSVASKHLPIIQNIMTRVERFDLLGESIYKSVNGAFKQRLDITIAQQKKKWWRLEERLTNLITEYRSPIGHKLLAVDEPAYNNFKNQLLALKAILDSHLKEITELNKNYNKINGEIQGIDPVIERLYTTWYTDCYESVNFPEGIDNQSINYHLETILETFLTAITTK